MTKLSEIQQKLKAPKGQENKFGGYKYRSCEDILEAVKPLLGDATLTLTDDIVEIGGRVYVKATATFTGEDTHTTTAFAREAEAKKGMDESQITGSASSYARKYALNGLFCIDDTRDADVTNDHADPVKVAKNRLVKAIAAYCEKTGQDKKQVMDNVSKQDGYQPTAAFYNACADSFENAVREVTM